jgi:subtilisin family serine protease
MKNIYNKVSKLTIAIALAASFFLVSCEKEPLLQDVSVSNSSDAKGLEHPHVPNQLLVKFKAGVTQVDRIAALNRINGRVSEKILTKAMEQQGDKDGLLLVNTPLTALEAIEKIKGLEIEYAELNYIYQHSATSDDPFYKDGKLYGMYGSATLPKNDFGSQAAVAWGKGKTGSESVYIGIIDEGVMFRHDDLAANMGTNSGEIPANGIDDDGNGFIDDVYGWDFDANDNTIYDGTQDDHGTHVAGTIGAKGGNTLGVAGVCWNVKLLNAKFLGRMGGTTANAIKAVDYFTNLKTRESNRLNIVATNNSWGGGGYSIGLFNAIERANAAGILFIAAAGNGGSDGVGDDNDKTPHYPSSYANTNVIAVAAITSTGARSGFSNYGALSVDLGAPGSGINSTLPGKGDKSVYGSYSGTSMATPHVTGAVALYAAINPTSTAAQIKSAVLSSATSTPSMAGKTVSGGRLNVSGF